MNYSKMAGQFVCKMAMPLALMFAACSTDEGSQPLAEGGSSEEPSIVAYENITLNGRAYYAPKTVQDSVSLDKIGTSVSANVFWTGGSVTLRELDSVTLEWTASAPYTVKIGDAVKDPVTGEMTPANDGMIRFDSVSFNSPYVMLIATSDGISLRTILDLRDADSFVIDAWSHLLASRLQKLVASGKSFAEAKAQAETEMASLFGLESLDFSEKALVRDELNEFSVDLLRRLETEIGETGAVDGLSASTKEGIERAVLYSRQMQVLLFPESAFERLGDDAAQYYQECLKKKKVMLHVLASVYGYGRCSSTKEGVLFDITDEYLKLKCMAGSWELYDNRVAELDINPQLGTMVDSRDGQTYKTVTFDFDGVSQTWMAENLNYVTEKSSCYEDSSYCPVYGRLYSVFPLDSTYNKYASEEDCYADRMEVWIAELRAVKGEVTEDDSLRFDEAAHELCKELKDNPENPDRVNWNKVIDSLDVLGYDVCPEGWRMPSYEDWKTLLSHVDYNLLQSSYGNPTGFGLDILSRVRGSDGRYKISVRNEAGYLFTPRPTPEEMLGPMKEYVGDAIGMIATRNHSFKNGRLTVVYKYAMPTEAFVRCIKND